MAKIKCPRCSGTTIISQAQKVNKEGQVISTYKCADCKKIFVVNHG